MKRPFLWLLAAIGLVFFLSAAEAQQPSRTDRIGFLQRSVAPTSTNPDPLADAFLQGMRELGYVQNKNIQIEHRYAGGRSERLPGLVAELVKLEVDVIVVASTQALRAARKATNTIPIVIITQVDPVAEGLVDSLSRLGGNITGITRLTHELSGKRLELFKNAVPRLSRVGILNGGTDFTENIRDYEATARALKIVLHSLDLHGPKPHFEETFEAAAKGGIDGIIVSRDALTASYSKIISELSIKYRLPSMNRG